MILTPEEQQTLDAAARILVRLTHATDVGQIGFHVWHDGAVFVTGCCGGSSPRWRALANMSADHSDRTVGEVLAVKFSSGGG